MQCKQCGMTYDGPPENFPASGYCPGCDPAYATTRSRERATRDRDDQEARERQEQATQAAIDNEIQLFS